ncbi:MAG: hypothetical protein C4320_00770 [Armatimonadota bacterium]
MISPLPSAIQGVLDDLAFLEDRRARIEYLIAIGESYRPADEQEVPRRDEAKVAGCESEVFFHSEKMPEGRVRVRYAVDNPQGISAMAMAKVLEDGVSNVEPERVAAIPDSLAEEMFGQELSMGKGMGLGHMVRMAKEAARDAHERTS